MYYQIPCQTAHKGLCLLLPIDTFPLRRDEGTIFDRTVSLLTILATYFQQVAEDTALWMLIPAHNGLSIVPLKTHTCMA